MKGINFIDLKDAGDPVEQAKIYSDGGADEICFLDITASNENRNTIYEVVEKTSKRCFVPLTVGGGVRSVEDINKLLNCGAEGQLTFGAIVSGGVALLFYEQEGFYILPIVILAGAIGGMLYASIPAILKTYFNTNEGDRKSVV